MEERSREMGFCFQGNWARRQPWRGIFALIVSLAVSLVLTASFNIQEYTGIVGYLTMSFIPLFVIIGMFWKRVGIIPLEALSQPFKGILLTTFAGIIGVLTAMGLISFLGKGVLLPHLILHLVCTIITTFFIALAFGFWPFNKLSPVAGGFLCVIVAYVIGWVILQFFNFAMLSYPTGVNPSPIGKVPFYAEGGPLAEFVALAPMGPFLWEHSLSFYFWGISIVFAFLLINFWPFSAFKITQPLFGILITVAALVISYIVNFVCIDVLKVEPLRCFLYGVSFVFGILLILIPFEMWPGRAIGKLLGGVINILIAIGVGIVAYKVLLSFCQWHFGEGMKYPNDIFAVATLMLGMIFPMWACYSDLFDFWPLPFEK